MATRYIFNPFTNNLDTVQDTGVVFITRKSDFPSPISNVITLKDNTVYFITTEIDLTGDSIVCGQNTNLIGGSSESCIIKSTGLTTPMINSTWSLPMRNITLTADHAINLDATGNADQALDIEGLNFTNCAVIGTVKNYSNFIMVDSSFLNSANMTFDGTIGTIGFSGSFFLGIAGQTSLILPDTLTITRRCRIIYSSFVIFGGATGIDFDSGVTVPTESYILDTVNFSGGATYLAGINDTSNKALFINSVGVINTSVNGQMYMRDNATATTIADTAVFYKVLGTTAASADNSKYSHTNNRLTCEAVIERKYLIQCTLSFNSNTNNVVEFGFYDSKLGAMREPSKTKATANQSNRAENVTFNCVVNHAAVDYIEIYCRNTTNSNDVTVTDMNVVITQFN